MLPLSLSFFPPSLCLALTLSTSLSECASVAESCNHDLVHPYRDNDRSPDHGSWYLWPLRRDVEVVKLLILNEKPARNCSPRIMPQPQGFAGFQTSDRYSTCHFAIHRIILTLNRVFSTCFELWKILFDYKIKVAKFKIIEIIFIYPDFLFLLKVNFSSSLFSK